MLPNINDQFDLPSELCAKPLALVGMCGLDTVNNSIHKLIWETFNGRLEKAPVLYKLIGNAHEFPVIKPKRNSYEWYIPKGILKRNWMNKHLNEIPAVMVIFYDLDWNDPLWNEKMIECASRVQSMRAALDGRATKITVVLIQNSPPLPAGEDVLGSERAISLCASCELNAKSLFVLPHGDHLFGYVTRLESAFYDLAQNYYHLEARNIKSHRDHLNKTTHQYLFIRHQFKMAFLNELKQDFHAAHKHYTHAYNNLLEMRIVDTNAMEVRTIAGFINYKLCRVMFSLNLPRDAISQFRAHTERFKTRMGFQELAFEHHAWMSKQYSVFGDIFYDAVKLGLPAVQTQHPGIYYQQAAQHAILRKQACAELCSKVYNYPSPDPLEGMHNMEFYGQRPWRPGKLSADVPDPQIEANGIQALQFLETKFNHSQVIITLYGHAIAQYKTYRCPRTRRHLVIQMAEEYYSSQDFGKAFTLLSHMLWDYRQENWWDIISSILEKATKCAFLTGNVQDFLQMSLELLVHKTTVPYGYKRKIYENLNRILKKQIPEPEENLPERSVANALTLWQKALITPKLLSYSLDISNVTSCVDCKARFIKTKYEVDSLVTVELFIRSNCPFQLNFYKVSVFINTPSTSSEFGVSDVSTNPTLMFMSNEVKRFLVEFIPDYNDVDKEIQIGSVILFMGDADNCSLELKLSAVPPKSTSVCPEMLHFKRCLPNMPDFDNIRSQSTALLIPRHSYIKVTFNHNQPALIGEWYEVEVGVKNEEEYSISNVELKINLNDDEPGDHIEFSLRPSEPREKLPINIKLKDLELSETATTKFYLRSNKAEDRTINFSVSFTLDRENPIVCSKNETLSVSIVKPFEVATRFLSTMFEEVSKLYVEENFVIMPIIECLSSWPIVIETTKLTFAHNVVNDDESLSSQVNDMQLDTSECATEVYLALIKKPSEVPVTIGEYTIQWKRVNGLSTTTKLPITGLAVDWIPLNLRVVLPAHGLVRTPMLIKYLVHNKSHQLVQLDVTMEASEAFMYAGYRQYQISVLPESTKVLEYNLYPLVAGSVALPKLTLTIPESSTGPGLRQDQINQLLERALPTHLFVMPQQKGPVTQLPRVSEIPTFSIVQ